MSRKHSAEKQHPRHQLAATGQSHLSHWTAERAAYRTCGRHFPDTKFPLQGKGGREVSGLGKHFQTVFRDPLAIHNSLGLQSLKRPTLYLTQLSLWWGKGRVIEVPLAKHQSPQIPSSLASTPVVLRNHLYSRLPTLPEEILHPGGQVSVP